MVFFSNGEEETKRLAEIISRHIKPGDVICLEGDLGAGKTQFAKGFAKGLGVAEHVTSPTFTLINEYCGRLPFYHIDAYRLEEPDEAYELGLDEYFYGEGVTLIEWPSRIAELLPTERLAVHIEKDPADDKRRIIKFEPLGDRYKGLVQELSEHCTF